MIWNKLVGVGKGHYTVDERRVEIAMRGPHAALLRTMAGFPPAPIEGREHG